MDLNLSGRATPEMEERVFQLHERDQLNYATIAKRTGLTSRTVSRIVKRVKSRREAEKKQTA